MPVSPEVFRALGALCEPPEPAHARLAAALGLPEPPDAATFTEVFVFQLVPYAAPYLSPDGMLGGEPADRVAGFWRALNLTPPAEPDHLAALLGLYAALGEQENTGSWPTEAWRGARRALLWEHLLTWVPIYAEAMTALPSPFHREWARLLREALLEEARTLPPPPSLPLHLRNMPGLPDPDSGQFSGALLAPARSGLLITRSDLVTAAAATGLRARAGGRAFILGALIDSDRSATFGWLAQQATSWAGCHRGDLLPLQGIARHWLGRAQASLDALQSVRHTMTCFPRKVPAR